DRRVQGDKLQDIDALLTGYTLLAQKDGWEYTRQILKTPTHGFTVRYAALLAVRYFRENSQGGPTQEKLIQAYADGLNFQDMADFAVDDLRKAKFWKYTELVLALPERDGFGAPIIRRSVLRYALQCPDAQAVRYVARMRMANRTEVEEVEETLGQK